VHRNTLGLEPIFGGNQSRPHWVVGHETVDFRNDRNIPAGRILQDFLPQFFPQLMKRVQGATRLVGFPPMAP
jgi:hypothetical protein